MKNIEIYNTLNIDKDSSSIVATFTQEDDAVMEFKLFKDGQEIVLKDQTISLGAERKDGAVIEQDDGFLIKENNVLNITLKKNIIQVVGVVKIQLYLKDKSGEMASNTFNIRVNKKLLGAENVEATNDIKVLNTLVLELKNNTNKLIDDTKAKADKVIEDTKAEVDNIKKDYEGLKKVVIDENIGIKLQKDVTELQNGLKSNQALAYSGSSINAENTLEGRTEGMSIKGLTLQNLWKPISIQWEPTNKWFNALASSINFDITGKVITVKNITNKAINFQFSKLDNNYDSQVVISPLEIKVINVTSLQKFRGVIGLESVGWENTTENKNKLINGLIVCIGEHSYLPNTYFEGIKSFGEAEQEGDKYKISILSTGKNLAKLDLSNKNITPFEDGYRLDCVALYRGDEDIFALKGKYKENTQYVLSYYGKILDNSNANNYRIRVYYTDNTYTDGVVTGNKYEKRIIKTLSGKTVYKIIGYYGSMNGDFIVKDVMLEEGTQATQYELYKCDKKDILISAPLPGFDFGEDIMYEENGQVKITRNIDTYTFTGDETIRDTTEQDEKSGTGKYKVFVLTINKTIDKNKNINNNFPKKQFSVAFQKVDSEGLAITQYGVYIKILKSKLSTQDIEGLKAWLKANTTTIYFARATPVTEIVENCVDIDLDTYQEKTYFNILNSLPGTLDFKVPSNIGSVVQNMAKEVNNIWDVINNLLVPGILDVNKKVALATIKNNLK